MSWKATFDNGVACFKRGDLEQALVYMNQAAELETRNFIIYDSRAAVHEKLGNIKAALLDSKRAIDVAPGHWQGYARSARLFDLIGKCGHVIKMVDHALGYLRPEDVQRRTQLVDLREKAIAGQAAAEKQAAETSYLLGKLPVETLVEIFSVLIDEDHTWAVRLSHVCGQWRRILVNTPSAWQTLVLSRKHPLRKVKLWKERAGSRIARISVDVSELDMGSVLAQLQDLSWVNLSCLHISGDAFAELHRILSDISLPHTFSRLDELALDRCGSRDTGLSCWRSGPDWRLKILRLSGLIRILPEWPVRIQQLKELHLDGVIPRYSPLVFTTNPSLEKFILNCEVLGHNNLDFDNNANLILMKNLKIVGIGNVGHPFHVLHAISTPSITHFSMQSAVVSDQALLHVAAHSSLVELRIVRCNLSSSTLPTLLPSTPNLETLHINSIHGVVNEMFEFLTPRTVNSQGGLPCRALKHVDVSKCSDLMTSSAYAFVKTRTQFASEFVGSTERCAIVVSLKLDGCPNIEPDMLPWFRSKVAQFSCVYATRKDFANRRRQP